MYLYLVPGPGQSLNLVPNQGIHTLAPILACNIFFKPPHTQLQVLTGVLRTPGSKAR